MSDIFESDLTNGECTAVTNREEFEKSLTNIWGHSTLGLEAKKAAMAMLATKNGMYARIPLICKAQGCPYADQCKLLQFDLAPIGEPCPKESAEVELRYSHYSNEFDLEESSFTDRNLVSDIITFDIMLDRLRALLRKEEVLIVDVVTGISEQGEEFTHPEVSKTWEAYERVSRKRNEAYGLMLATRKDKKGTESEQGADSITQIVSTIMNNSDFVIDAKPADM